MLLLSLYYHIRSDWKDIPFINILHVSNAAYIYNHNFATTFGSIAFWRLREVSTEGSRAYINSFISIYNFIPTQYSNTFFTFRGFGNKLNQSISHAIMTILRKLFFITIWIHQYAISLNMSNNLIRIYLFLNRPTESLYHHPKRWES